MANDIQQTAQHAVDATLGTVGWHTTKIGGAVYVGSWLLSAPGAAFVGIVGVLIGLAMQAVFGWRRDKREKLESEARTQREKAESDLRITLLRDKLAMHEEAGRLEP
jgi:hypothetical protein